MGVVKLSTAGILDYSKTSNFLSGNAPYIPVFPAYDLLETTTLTSNTASVTFSGLGAYSDYKHLQVRGIASYTDYSEAFIQFNGQGNSATYYTSHALQGDGSTISSFRQTNSMRLGYFGNSTTSFEPFITDVLDFANTNKNKTVRSLVGANIGIIQFDSGLYLSTSAVTSITFATAGFWRTNSRFSLYGVK